MNSAKIRLSAVFVGGVLVGALTVGAMLLTERSGQAASARYASGGSWNQTATAAVNDLRTKGIIVAPSAAAYNGGAYVTRFEAAVLIDRFVHYVQAGRKPLHPTTLKSNQMPSIERGPAHAEMVDLVKNRYITPTSSLLVPPGTANVTASVLSDTMTTAVERTIDRGIAPSKNDSSDM